VERTPPGFLCDIKAFGFLTQHPIDPRRLPDVVRERLPGDVLEKGRLYHGGVPADVRELIWLILEPTIGANSFASSRGACE
jgi:hypothetical protein